MKLRGGCLSRDDIDKILETLNDSTVSKWQKDNLVRLIKIRRGDLSDGASIHGALLDRRIQELAWLRPLNLQEGQPDVPRELVATQIGSAEQASPMVAHCFNSHIVHTPEYFKFTKAMPGSPYVCGVFTGAEAKQLCEVKARKSKTFMGLDDEKSFSINADLNSQYFNKRFNYFMDAERRSPSAVETTTTTTSVTETLPLTISSTKKGKKSPSTPGSSIGSFVASPRSLTTPSPLSFASSSPVAFTSTKTVGSGAGVTTTTVNSLPFSILPSFTSSTNNSENNIFAPKVQRSPSSKASNTEL